MAKHGSSRRITRPMQWCVKLHVEQKHFPSGQIPGPGLPKAARELCTASPANIKPLCSIQVSWMRGSSLCRLDLAWWREVDVETGVALRYRSETSAVVLVSCSGLCLAHGKPALRSAITTKGCWPGPWGQGGWSGGSLLAGTRCQQLCCVLFSHLALQPPHQTSPKSFSTMVLPQGYGKVVASDLRSLAPNWVSSLDRHRA